ncbi:conserved exported hypothetical protein [Vibrio chagasii]|nr:conserved exported hypothetical protein [Vibrio chagasii]
MMKLKTITLSILAATPMMAQATDTRSMGMGGTGVASSNYLTSSFHNPALAASYGERDNFGMILPVVSASASDADDMIDKIDHFQMLDDELQFDPTNPETIEEWKKALADLDGGKVSANVTLGAVVAIPNKYVSTNMFVRGEVVTLATTSIDESDFDKGGTDEPLNSTVQGLGGGILDIGFTFAKDFEVADRELLVGISPKFQQLYAVNYSNTVDGFDEDDFNFDDEYTKSSGFNIDLGVAYSLTDNIMLGLSGRNLISNTLETNESLGQKATFQVKPEYTMGIAYNKRLYSLAIDVDLNERQYFEEFKHSSQFARLGGELNAWDWAQLRAGYKHSMTDYQEDMVTAGIGLKPFGKFGLDISGEYGKDNNYGVSAQMIFTF